MMRDIADKFFQENPHYKDGVMKAYYAYHAPHSRLEPKGHNFTNGSRESRCAWCDRSREMVRHDDLSPECQNRPAYADIPIADVIRDVEQKAFALLAKAERIVPKMAARMGLSGETLAVLHHTHGYDPETVAGIIEVPPQMLNDYNASMEAERQRSRNAQVKERLCAQYDTSHENIINDNDTLNYQNCYSHL